MRPSSEGLRDPLSGDIVGLEAMLNVLLGLKGEKKFCPSNHASLRAIVEAQRCVLRKLLVVF